MAEMTHEKEFWPALGERIREARESQALSAVELGQRLGYSEDTIYNWEKARRRITLEDLLRVSEQTGKPVSWFLGESPGTAFEAHIATLLSKTLAEFMPMEPNEEWGRVRDAADRAGLSAGDLIRMIAAWQAAK